MPVNYIPTLQNPLAGSNLGNITSALKAPAQPSVSPLLAQANTNLQKSLSDSLPDSAKMAPGLNNLFSNGNIFPSSTFLNADPNSGPGFMNF